VKAGEGADVAAGSEIKMRLACAVAVNRNSVNTEKERDGGCFCILRGFQKLFKMVGEGKYALNMLCGNVASQLLSSAFIDWKRFVK
jgi:hypothetical protein